MEEMIDITPQAIGGKGSAGRTTTVFQEAEWNQILNNLERLTKEGVEERIEYWKHSNNKHVLMKYQTMLKQCKTLKPSDSFTEGDEKVIVLSVNEDGTPRWTKKIKVKKEASKSSSTSTTTK